jgi:acetyl esterase/lipase
MSFALLAAGAFFAAGAVLSHRPLYRPGGAAVVSFFLGWLTSELPLHNFGFQAAVAVALGAMGALESWPGLAGLSLCVLSWAALAAHFRLARRTPEVVREALAAPLGPENAAPLGPRAPWWRLALVLPVRPAEVEVVRDVPYHCAAGRDLHLDVYRLRSRPSGCPTLLYVHGGGWVVGSKGQQGLPTIHHLASLGWVCVTINYRLSPRATFPEHLLDVKQAIRWVRERGGAYGADPALLVLAGGSAGAHLASLAALTPNVREYQADFPEVDTTVQGCIAYYGVYDFVDRERHWPHAEFRLFLERLIMKRRLHEEPEAFEKASPVHRVGSHAPPFFVIHGDRDSMAPVAGARAFHQALQRAACAPLAYLELPGAQHAFELFPSFRCTEVVRGVARFCEHLRAQREGSPLS